MQERRIVLFGGTFDPIHRGHLVVAQYAREYLLAERVILIPAGRAPHKMETPTACGTDRIEMIRLAISDSFGMEFSDCELSRPQPSYTLDTVRYFQDMFGPGIVLYWLVGADLAKDIANWYRAKELIDSCRIAVMFRAGFSRPDFTSLVEPLGSDRVRKLQQYVIPAPLVDVSSSDIRNRIARGEDVGDRVKPIVWDYIFRKGLYGRKDPEKGS